MIIVGREGYTPPWDFEGSAGHTGAERCSMVDFSLRPGLLMGVQENTRNSREASAPLIPRILLVADSRLRTTKHTERRKGVC